MGISLDVVMLRFACVRIPDTLQVLGEPVASPKAAGVNA